MFKEPNWNELQEKQQALIETLDKELGWFQKEEIDNTARRVVGYYKELWNKQEFKFTTFDAPLSETNSMIVLKDIDFYSMCSHHLLPFFGKAFVAYLPKKKGKICGISKLARVVAKHASKPQIQERMTNNIADELMKMLDAKFVMVIVDGQHLCMLSRGIKQNESVMCTSAIRWDKKSKCEISTLKDEAMRLFGK
jgi:GTP cyclohydrolase I